MIANTVNSARRLVASSPSGAGCAANLFDVSLMQRPSQFQIGHVAPATLPRVPATCHMYGCAAKCLLRCRMSARILTLPFVDQAFIDLDQSNRRAPVLGARALLI